LQLKTIRKTIQSMEFSKWFKAFIFSVICCFSLGSLSAQVPCDLISSPTFADPWGGDVNFDDFPPAGEFQVPIPFTFCFYDQTYTSLYINNNGNITFGAGYNTFTAAGFPDNFVPPMIAPFWGDVDTGDNLAPLGQARFEVFPDYAIVFWDNVGVFPGTNPAQRNSFQVIISDGNSNILPPGCNVGFIYGDMQWTTGTASGGTNGFGGTPANVGVNRGDGVGFVQIGRFDADNSNYDGPYGNNDGVNFLDNKEFFFNVCIPPGGGNNIPPFASFSGANSNLTVCDPVYVCSGASRNIEFDFYPVEQGQTVSAVEDPLIPSSASLVLTTTVANGPICHVEAEVDAVATPPGTYTVSFTATDNGTPAATCTFEIQIIVTAPTLAVAITGENAICEGDVASLYVADSINYLTSYWFPINSNYFQLGTADAGTYNVVAIDASGDCGIAAHVLQVNPNPTPVIEGESSVCVNDPSSTAEIAVSQSYQVYDWFEASGFPVPGGSLQTVFVGAGDYIVEVTDQNGCMGTSPMFTVNATSVLSPEILGSSVSCFDNEVTLAADIAYPIYEWVDLSTNLTVSNDSSIQVLNGFYRLNVGDGAGCSGSDIFAVTNVVPIADAGVTPPAACSNTDIEVGTTALPLYSYLWLPTTVVADSLASQTTVNFVNLSDEPIDYQLILLATSNGCTAFDTVTVTVNPQPSASFDVPEPQCFEGNSFDFAAEGDFNSGATFNWNFGSAAVPATSSDLNPQDIQFNGTGIHTVKLSITDAGCESFNFELPVIIRPMPVANFTADVYAGCAPLPVNFANSSQSSDPINEFKWNFGDGTLSSVESPLNQFDAPGNFTVSLAVSTEYGCRDTFEIPNLISVYPNAIAKFTLTPPVLTLDNPNCSITDYSTNADEVTYHIAFLDTFFQPNLTYTFADTGSYEIQQIVSNEFGCMDSLTLTARVQDGFHLFIPNSFSPDGDNKNDYFKVFGQDISSFSMKVYSRWGQLLYSSNDYESGWDGTTRLNDAPLASGAYFYIINVTDINNNSKTVEGMFTIYR
jgi:gliding motility-associated-like protein